MNSSYIIPVLAKDIYVGESSLYEMSERIIPNIREIDSNKMIDKDTLSYLCNSSNIPTCIVAYSDGVDIYEAETTTKLSGDKERFEEYRVNAVEALEIFVRNENYVDQATTFFKKGKTKTDIQEKKHVKSL